MYPTKTENVDDEKFKFELETRIGYYNALYTNIDIYITTFFY